MSPKKNVHQENTAIQKDRNVMIILYICVNENVDKMKKMNE